MPDKVHLLIKTGASPMVNSKNEMPAVGEILINLYNSAEEKDQELFDQMMHLPNISDFVSLKDRRDRRT